MRTKQSLTLADVKTMMAACEAKAAASKWAVAISIVDDGGFLLGFVRMDGAPVITAEVSTGKARASAMTRRPSKFFEDRIKERPAFLNFPAGILLQAACRSCFRTNASARSACPACNRMRTNRWPRRVQAHSPELIWRGSYSAGTPASSGCRTGLLSVSPNVDTAANRAKPAST